MKYAAEMVSGTAKIISKAYEPAALYPQKYLLILISVRS
jgi:hypothetical protein